MPYCVPKKDTYVNFRKIIFEITRLWKTLELSYNFDEMFLSVRSITLWIFCVCSCKQTVFVTLMKTSNRRCALNSSASLHIQEYKWVYWWIVRATWQDGWEITFDRLRSHPGGVAILFRHATETLISSISQFTFHLPNTEFTWPGLFGRSFNCCKIFFGYIRLQFWE